MALLVLPCPCRRSIGFALSLPAAAWRLLGKRGRLSRCAMDCAEALMLMGCSMLAPNAATQSDGCDDRLLLLLHVALYIQ